MWIMLSTLPFRLVHEYWIANISVEKLWLAKIAGACGLFLSLL